MNVQPSFHVASEEESNVIACVTVCSPVDHDEILLPLMDLDFEAQYTLLPGRSAASWTQFSERSVSFMIFRAFPKG